MKNILFKAILLLLCFCMMLSTCAMLASCNSKKEQEDEVVDDFVEEEDGPKLPEKKYNSNFVFLGSGKEDFYVEDAQSGDIVEYAMYMRNVAIEEKYGVKIILSELYYGDVPGRVSDLIKANDSKSVDIVTSQMTFSSNIVIAGNAMDWYSVPYINFDDEWWPDFNKDALTLNGKAFLVTNDFLNTSITDTSTLYFNKELVKKYSMGDIYAVVEDGKWTYEKMTSLITGVYDDLNKNEREDAEDLYGYRYSSRNAFIYGFDNPVFSKNENTGEFEFSYFSNKLTRAARNLVNLYGRTEGVYEGQMSDFVKGNAVFTHGNFARMMDELREMSDWGIVPLPKYNTKQETYTSILGPGATGLLVPKLGGGEEKLEKIGVVITDLSYRSYKDVRTKLYDKALKGKYVDDVKEAKMIDLIYSGRRVDFGATYMGFDAPGWLLQNMLASNDYDVQGAYLRNKPMYENLIEKIYASFGLAFPGLP